MTNKTYFHDSERSRYVFYRNCTFVLQGLALLVLVAPLITNELLETNIPWGIGPLIAAVFLFFSRPFSRRVIGPNQLAIITISILLAIIGIVALVMSKIPTP